MRLETFDLAELLRALPLKDSCHSLLLLPALLSLVAPTMFHPKARIRSATAMGHCRKKSVVTDANGGRGTGGDATTQYDDVRRGGDSRKQHGQENANSNVQTSLRRIPYIHGTIPLMVHIIMP